MHGVIVVNATPPPSTATTVAPSTTALPVTTAALRGSTPESVAAASPGSTATSIAGPRLAHTGSATGAPLALGFAALVLGLAAWGVSTPRRGVVSRLRR
jgi:hypothetical protein